MFEYNDNREHVLLNISTNEGSIFIVKDSDNKIKFFHVLIGKGRTDVEINVSDLESQQKHMITATWDAVNDKKIKLYIDGSLKENNSQIVY
jgi:hypothetical protein